MGGDDDLRGVGQGSHKWDLQPGSTMTSGLVGKLEGTSSRRLTLLWHGGQQTVVVAPDVPIVRYEDANLRQLAAGAHVVAAVAPSTAGVLRASRIVVGGNGAVPPM